MKFGEGKKSLCGGDNLNLALRNRVLYQGIKRRIFKVLRTRTGKGTEARESGARMSLLGQDFDNIKDSIFFIYAPLLFFQ